MQKSATANFHDVPARYPTGTIADIPQPVDNGPAATVSLAYRGEWRAVMK
jgi:hypothetical protein